MVEYIHEWPIWVKAAPDSDKTFKIYAHDHKECDIEHPQPETLEESRIVTWKNHFYHDKGKLWEQRMIKQGWSPEAAKVKRNFSGQRILNELVRYYVKEEADRVPVEKWLRRPGR